MAAYLIDTALLQALFWALLVIFAAGETNLEDILATVAKVGAVVTTMERAYFALMESSPAQATLGKMALGIYVTDKNGDPVTFLRALWRTYLKYLSSLLLMFGWVLAAMTPRKQALHDLLAGTLVLRRATVLLAPVVEPELQPEHWDGRRWLPPQPTPPAS